jgi:hypothetical protein
MKMAWSWWPNIGFEPRYGGDIAFGAFAIDSYLTFNTSSYEASQALAQFDQMTGNNTTSLPQNITSSYDQAVKLAAAAQENFDLGWYTVAKGQINDALTYVNAALSELQPLIPLREQNTTLLALFATAVVIILVSNLYWYKRLTGLTKYRRIRHKQRQK